LKAFWLIEAVVHRGAISWNVTRGQSEKEEGGVIYEHDATRHCSSPDRLRVLIHQVGIISDCPDAVE
jgi:hypothetical protein